MSTTSPDANVPADGALQRAVARLLGSPFFWLFFLAVAFGWPIVRVARTALPPDLPVLGSISSFDLVEQYGHAFGAADVRGRVWVLSAVQTSSPSADRLATELGKIQHRARNLGPAFHLVTAGVDRDVDTVENLLAFTNRHHVSPRMWSFLSGNTELLLSSAQGGPLSVTLVDQKMRVRGRYDLAEKGAVDQVLYEAGLLVNRGH